MTRRPPTTTLKSLVVGLGVAAVLAAVPATFLVVERLRGGPDRVVLLTVDVPDVEAGATSLLDRTVPGLTVFTVDVPWRASGRRGRVALVQVTVNSAGRGPSVPTT